MNAQQLKGMIGMIRNMQNPQAMVEQMIRNNPNMMQALQAQINQLQLQNAMSGVLKFPNAWTFTGGNFPPLTTTAAGA